METIKLLDIVALVEDLPDQGLRRGFITGRVSLEPCLKQPDA
jgi:hypothetical protein